MSDYRQAQEQDEATLELLYAIARVARGGFGLEAGIIAGALGLSSSIDPSTGDTDEMA